MRKTYLERKEEARNRAIEWQLAFGDRNMSWSELAGEQDELRRLGKRYGLLREFKENGIC